MKTQHTSGEWKITPFENRGYLILCNNEPLAHVKHIYGDVEDKANAKLIAEAGTVTNECGLTPRQLLEQRNELLEAAKYYQKGIGHFYDCINFGKSFLDAKAIEFMNTVGIKITEAIKKAIE